LLFNSETGFVVTDEVVMISKDTRFPDFQNLTSLAIPAFAVTTY
jgi:hypothetical protein